MSPGSTGCQQAVTCVEGVKRPEMAETLLPDTRLEVDRDHRFADPLVRTRPGSNVDDRIRISNRGLDGRSDARMGPTRGYVRRRDLVVQSLGSSPTSCSF